MNYLPPISQPAAKKESLSDCFKTLAIGKKKKVQFVPIHKKRDEDWTPPFHKGNDAELSKFLSRRGGMIKALSETTVKYIQKVGSSFTHLTLKGVTITSEMLKQMSGYFPEVQAFTFVESRFADKDVVAYFPLFTKLDSLTFTNCKSLKDPIVEKISCLKQLKSLAIIDAFSVSEKGLSALGNLSSLRHLSISFCPGVTSGVVAVWAETLPHLTSLSLTFCRQVNDAAILKLSSLKELEELRLEFCNYVTEDALSNLSSENSSLRLHIVSCNRVSAQLQDELGRVCKVEARTKKAE